MITWKQFASCAAPKSIRALTAIIALVYTSALVAMETGINNVIPHGGEKAQAHFTQYQYSVGHKAFAIAPGGAWSWLAEARSEAQAEQQAIKNCPQNTQQKCVLYALNDRIVFDVDSWPGLWGPYADAASASKASVGVKVGQRFPDLTWLDAKNNRVSVGNLKGKIVILHFWGSWCPPCMREFPELKKLHEEIQDRHSGDVEMVMMQLRESFTDSQQWAQRFGFADLPLYDSGIKDSGTTKLLLKDGNQIEDRLFALVFPSSYVLDRNGLVLFSHRGPITSWLDYIDFIDHAAKSTLHSVSSTITVEENSVSQNMIVQPPARLTHPVAAPATVRRTDPRG